MSKVHLSLTVGPVQGFVAQARRTRDLWAGSWLLSYLTECALAAAEKAGGIAIIPYRGGGDREIVTSVRSVIGGMPNRFELVFESREAAESGAEAAQKGFHVAWRRLADAVWNSYVEPIAANRPQTKDIWQRQVDHFWKLSWVIVAPNEEKTSIGNWALARKAFRNVPATVESGVKCSLMGDLQEISGSYGTEQNDFWRTLVENLEKKSGAHALDFSTVEHEGGKRITERLCAIALIKRLFPHVLKSALTDQAQDADLDSLQEQIYWPSTAFFAALPWLQHLQREHGDEARAFKTAACNQGIKLSEGRAAKEVDLPTWAGIDAPAWFKNGLRQNEWGIEESLHRKLSKQLEDLAAKANATPVPYYGLLLMDGDLMGKALEKLGDSKELSRRLVQFTQGVHNVIRGSGGRTIYAGGDDVLAILPAEHALQAADVLAQNYVAAFEDSPAESVATLSGAIIYAYWKSPLRRVIASAHHLLDDIAKDRIGRDALAIGIVQSNGVNTLWSAPWKVIRGEERDAPALKTIIDEFDSDDTDREGQKFNASYLYHLRAQFRRLLGDFREEPGRFVALPEPLRANGASSELGLLGDIAHAEFRRRMSRSERADIPSDRTRSKIESLMALSRQWRRQTDENDQSTIYGDPSTFSFDAWRVTRFLRQIRDGKVVDHD